MAELTTETVEKIVQLVARYTVFMAQNFDVVGGTIAGGFDANGLLVGARGYYPVSDGSGQTVYVPCLARLNAIALGAGDPAALDALLAAQVAAANVAKAAAEAAQAAAGVSAGGAAASAVAANTSKLAAAASAAAVAVDRAQVELIQDLFGYRYLGDKAADPAVDNEGAALQAGAIYFNTVGNVLKVFNAGVWSQVAGATAADIANAIDAAKGAALVGNAETASSVKSVLDARPYCENVRGLRLFSKAMDKYRAAAVGTRRASQLFSTLPAPNSRLGFMSTGDSVATILSDGIVERLFERYDLAGTFGITPYTAFVPATTGVVVDHGALPVDQAVMGGVVGKADFTYLPNSGHYTLEDGATWTLPLGQSFRWTDAQAFFAKGPGLGSATFEILNEAGSATLVGPIATGSLADAAIGATHLTLAMPSLSTKSRLRVSAVGGRVELLAAFPRRANGVLYLPFAKGGSSLEQCNFSNKTILSYIVAQCNVVLATLHPKEENAAVNIPAWMNTLDTYLPAASKIVMGSSPDASPAANQLAIKNLIRTEALNRDYVYVDGYRLGRDYATQLAAGFMLDATHGNTFMTEQVGRHVWAECGFGGFYAPYLSSQVISPSVYAKSVGVTTQGGTTLEVMTDFSGADPTKAILHNLRGAFFGGDRTNANSIQFAAFGVNEGCILDKDDGFTKGFRAQRLTTTDAAVVSNFAGEMRFNGGARVTSYTVATLPSPNAALIGYASNGRKLAEGVGAGTGVFLYASGAQWRRCSDDTPVAA